MIWAILLMACDPEVECDAETACEFGSVCVEGFCEEIPCATSAQCEPGQFCADRACQEGCQEDSDCLPGTICNTDVQECVDRGCRDTQLDCSWGEFCNQASGECYDAGGYYCKSCADNSDCGDDGNMCVGIGGDNVCGVECADDADCPAGFGCLGVSESLTGPIISYQCLTYCWLGDESDDWSKAPPRPVAVDIGPILPTCPTDLDTP
jgi:hypothetical protein